MKLTSMFLTASCISLLLGASVLATAAHARGTAVKSGTSKAVTLSNLGNQPLRNINVKFGGNNPGDFSQTNNCGRILGNGKSCVINVTFMPKTTGSKSATLEVHTSGGAQVVYLTGTGT